MNNIIKLGFVITVALSAVACDKAPVNNITVVTPATSKPIPQTSNPIAQPALDAVEKAKQVEGIMKKEEETKKKGLDAK